MKFAPIAQAVFLAATGVAAEEPRGSPEKKPEPPVEKASPSGDLYSLGKQLFDALAPEDVKEEYEFISREQWETLTGRLQRALETGSLSDLAENIPALRAALTSARESPQSADLVAWLEERLDLAEAAEEASREVPPSPRPTPPSPTPKATPSGRPGIATPSPSPSETTSPIPHYALWKRRLAGRTLPSRAPDFMPAIKAAFAKEGIPTALLWLVEVESAFNPTARSPAGAKGLFQLMPATAESLGLSTFLPDERTDPAKSAQAAARFLKGLYQRFADWSLVLAAYNAGEGRVSRALSARKATTFSAISSALPTETQLYVPKVLATISLREGIEPGKLDAPRK